MKDRKLIKKSLYIGEDQDKNLAKISDGRSFSIMVRKSIDLYIDKHSESEYDKKDIRISEDLEEKIRESGIPGEELLKNAINFYLKEGKKG